MDLLWCSVNGKTTGEKCKIQQPCGMKNCMAQCQGLCYASAAYSAYLTVSINCILHPRQNIFSKDAIVFSFQINQATRQPNKLEAMTNLF